jgi:hypothetical protein
MPLNARQNAAKRKVKCIMMHAACWVYWSTIDEKPMLLVDKSTIKSDILTTKSRCWGSENLQAGDQLERQSGAKCRCCAQKWRKNKI